MSRTVTRFKFYYFHLCNLCKDFENVTLTFLCGSKELLPKIKLFDRANRKIQLYKNWEDNGVTHSVSLQLGVTFYFLFPHSSVSTLVQIREKIKKNPFSDVILSSSTLLLLEYDAIFWVVLRISHFNPLLIRACNQLQVSNDNSVSEKALICIFSNCFWWIHGPSRF